MTEERLQTPAPDGAIGDFWRFSLRLYDCPGVAAACLVLQDRFGRDVNLILFACWVGASGRGRLDAADFGRVEDAVAPWHRDIVEPLRALRRRTKDAADAAPLYQALKAAELAAERVAQDRLERLVPAAAGTPQSRLGDALSNLALYLGPGQAGTAAEPLRLALATLIADDG